MPFCESHRKNLRNENLDKKIVAEHNTFGKVKVHHGIHFDNQVFFGGSESWPPSTRLQLCVLWGIFVKRSMSQYVLLGVWIDGNRSLGLVGAGFMICSKEFPNAKYNWKLEQITVFSLSGFIFHGAVASSVF